MPTAPRTDFDPEELGSGRFYQVMTASIVPRPIAWVSTTSEDGVDNLAPHSFFTVACVAPPIVQFTSVGRKDSLRNIEATGEFVVSLTPEPLFEQVNATGTNYPEDVSEFDAVGLERERSSLVRPPRVAASPVALECRLHSVVGLGNSWVVLGRVVHAAVHTDLLADDGLPDIDRLAPLSRLGRTEWGTRGEIRRIDRIPYEAD
ncbi:flavin reductase family protein [Patulibacter sp.]|uniref:flavin reductase family protein n=1 Tax=Patulibacter sp. TaxID=1912859 RepID=UPI0027196894|nr:flavin reductase family protein [Patulibacter sp.]MDO9408642.1 flavin reductase family protein [Patulibacter sp.]